LKEQYFKALGELFSNWAGEEARHLEPLPQSGSYREYYRIHGHSKTAIGTYNADLKENRAFLSFSRHFHKYELPVPEVYAESSDGRTYLLSDLGDKTLFDLLKETRQKTSVFPGSIINYYKQALEHLPVFQIKASADLNYNFCYPRSAFDSQSMLWDLNYFKYYFLKLAKIPFDEQLLENDFNSLSEFLLSADDRYFLYRDFQSRNIMIHEDQLFFIDYQGGRRGALQYDVASLLYDSKANIPEEVKSLLLEHYLDALEHHLDLPGDLFMRHYHGFVMIRLMQAMGAYGFRGFYERRTQFLQSIPYALKQMRHLLTLLNVPISIPHLVDVLENMVSSDELKKYTRVFKTTTPLQVEITTFAYKNGIPANTKGHGGGYVFDCRCLHNPGKYERFKTLDGRDEEVMKFLKDDGEADDYMHNIQQIVDLTIDKYLSRGFTSLQLSLGCTGGQHRSVFCAEELLKHIMEKYPDQVDCQLTHRELQNKGAS